MITLIRTFLFNRKHPPALTADCCHICARTFHNRDHLFLLRDDERRTQAVCANMFCTWEMAKRYKKTYRHVSAVPYLIAKGVTKWVPET